MINDTGFVNAYNDFKGIGFIRRKKGKDVYFSIDDFCFDIELISISVEVSFDILKEKKGPRAYNMKIK
jgi:CspA family cold shock protein